MSEESEGTERIIRDAGVPLPGGNAPTIRVVESDEKPRILQPGRGRPISEFATELGRILPDNAGLYVRDGEVVSVDEEAKVLMPVGARAFRTLIEDWVQPVVVEHHARRGTIELPETLSLEAAATTLVSEQFKNGLRRVDRVHDQRLPVMRRDGRISRLEPGYDPEAKVFTLNSSLDYRMDLPAADGRNLWRNLHREFPFADWVEGDWRNGTSRSFAVHAAAALSQFAWCLLPGQAPRLHFIYYSNSERSGKSLLASIALVLTHGVASTTSWKKDEEKFGLSLDVLARNRSPYAFFDNLKGRLASEQLEGFMTGSGRDVRLYHTQVLRTFPVRTSVFLTGNALSWSSDIDGRVLISDLYLSDANPQARVIEHPMTQDSFLDDGLRSDCLASMWSWVSQWDRAGRPGGSYSKGGFHHWCRIFGGIVETAGFGAPVQSRPDDMAGGDTDATDMLALIEELALGIDTVAEYRFGDVVSAALKINAFEWLMKGREKRDEMDRTTFVLDPRERSNFSGIITDKFGGREFVLVDGRRIKWGHRGKNRGRHYKLEVLRPSL